MHLAISLAATPALPLNGEGGRNEYTFITLFRKWIWYCILWVQFANLPSNIATWLGNFCKKGSVV